MYDVLIIGGGVTGSAIARELSRYDLKTALFEKGEDVCSGTSKANSGIAHAGFDAAPGSWKAKMNIRGSRMLEELSRKLDFPYKRNGSLVLCFDEKDRPHLEKLLEQGKKNGVEGLEILEKKELLALEPALSEAVVCALHAPTGGIVCPFKLNIALAENAAANGVSFFFRTPVTQIRAIPGGWQVTAGGKRFTTRYLVNSAGLFSAQVAKLAGVGDYRIYPCRGEYFILDQIARDVLPLPVYPAPKQGAGGLGVHLTPTVHGNLLIGPSAEYIESPADTASTQPVLDELFRQAQRLLPGLERRQIIGAYAGIRPKQAPPGEGGYWDFVLREDRPGLIDLVGIESPGLTASAPLAEEVVELIGQGMDLTPDPTYDGHREGIPRFRDLPPDERAKLIEQDPDFGEVICRCQTVTKAELRRAIENPLGVKTIAGIKYRAWATTGRCQGGYCLPRIAQLLTEDYGLAPEDVTYRGDGSNLFVGRVK